MTNATVVRMKKDDLIALVEKMNQERDAMQDQIDLLELQLADAKDAGDMGIAKALRAIADHFHYDGDVWNRDLGQMVQGNTLAYTQEQVLNGLCWKVFTQIDQTMDKKREALEKARAAQRACTGDEISLQQLDRALDWVERFTLQLATLEDFYARAKEVHQEATGKPFVEPRKIAAPKGKPQEKMASLNARAKALGLDTVADEPNTDGVSTHVA